MTNADETPAQPTARTGGRCSDQCPTIFGITGPLCALPYGHLGSHESEHGTIWSFMPGVDSEPAVQPDVAPAQSDELVIEAVTPANLEATARATGGGYRSPDIELPDAAPVADGNAGGLGLAAIREGIETANQGGWRFDGDDMASMDAARMVLEWYAPALLAEVERLTRANADLRESIGARAIDDAHAERDEMAEDLAEAIRERDELAHGMAAWVRERMTPVIRERDEAQRQADVLKQQLDDRDADVAIAEQMLPAGVEVLPPWEPVTDDGGAPDA